MDDGARGPTGTIEVYQPDKSVVASRLSAHAFAIPGLEALSPSPPEAELSANKVRRLTGMRDSAASQAFYARRGVNVLGERAKCCSLEGAPELITGFWRGKEHPGHPVPRRAMRATDEHIWVVRAVRSTDRQYSTYTIHSTCKSAREHNKTASNTQYCAEVLWYCGGAHRRAGGPRAIRVIFRTQLYKSLGLAIIYSMIRRIQAERSVKSAFVDVEGGHNRQQRDRSAQKCE